MDKPIRRASSPAQDFLPLFKMFGVAFRVNGSSQPHAEECPFCGGTKFYVNPQSGQYQCHSANSCGAKGNAYTFVRHAYETRLQATTDDDYRQLKDKRGLPLQTLKRHGLAWDAANGCWLIPFKSENGEVQNLTRYYPEPGRKLALPGLPLRLYGLDSLSADAGRTLFLCEGPWDAIALDQRFVACKSRARYDILAAPSANVFRPEWLKHLAGRTVRLCYDNDKAGREGQERVAKLVREGKVDCKLFSLAWPDGYPEKCDVSDLVRDDVNVAEFTRQHCVMVTTPGRRVLFTRGDQIPRERTAWLWPGRIPFSTFASLSGQMGTHKSGIVKDIVARATAGLAMPLCDAAAVAPFDVLFLTSEDSQSQVCDLVRLHGGDLTRLHIHDIACVEGEPIDFLEEMETIEADINALKVRLVVLDALNSFVGGDISSDAKARRTLSGRLMSLARRTGACVLGVRNWGKSDIGTASQKVLGAASLSDVARCVMNTKELKPDKKTNERKFQLEFEKVSGAPKPFPIPYRVVDMHTCDADSHLRRLVWEKGKPRSLKETLKGCTVNG